MIKKDDLAASVAEATGSTKAQGAAAVDAVFAAIAAGLGEGKDVRLTGIGTLKVKAKAASTARNPRTGEQIAVPAKNVVKFSSASELDAAINA